MKTNVYKTYCFLKLHLNFDVYATRKVESHKGIDCLVSWLVDIDETVVSSQFEVLHRLLVDVWTTDDAEASKVSW